MTDDPATIDDLTAKLGDANDRIEDLTYDVGIANDAVARLERELEAERHKSRVYADALQSIRSEVRSVL